MKKYKALVELLNIVSSIATITGVSVLTLKTSFNISVAELAAIFLLVVLGLLLITLVVGISSYYYSLLKNNLRLFSKLIILLAFLLTVGFTAIIYIKLSTTFLYNFLVTLIGK